jgi:hemolysin-activating ACP:hemolysin acyltransferase
MFFRPKNGKDGDKPEPSPDKTAAPPAQAAIPGKGTAPAITAVSSGEDRTLRLEVLERRAEAAQREAAAIGQIVTLMIGSQPYKDRKLSDLRVTVLPAIRTGQYAVASGQSRSKGYARSLAAVLWACVSPEVDKRLSDPKSPARLNLTEWKCGDILWLVETIGDDRAIQALIQRLRANQWKGKSVKLRTTDAKGQVTIRTIEPPPEPNGTTDRTN